MALTRDYKETVQKRLNNDPEFARALLHEAVELMLGGDAETARLILRDLVNATLGFERLAAEMQKSSKSLHRMLSLSGNPTMSNLTDIFVTLQKEAGLDLQSSNLPTEVMGTFAQDMSPYKAFEFAGEYCRAIDSGVHYTVTVALKRKECLKRKQWVLFTVIIRTILISNGHHDRKKTEGRGRLRVA
jgi:DNA-binding phage protein